MKKVWFITGSSTGFGRELAEQALEQGYSVIATARRPEVLRDLIEKYPNTARAVRLDVTDPAEARTAIEQAIQSFGRNEFLKQQSREKTDLMCRLIEICDEVTVAVNILNLPSI